jgi:hypothetical protein
MYKNIKLSTMVLMTSLLCNAEYVHFSQIHPAQIAYASKDVKSKMKEAIKEGNAIKDEQSNSWKFKHFNGKSIFPEKKQLAVVKARCGYVLVDGHHKVLASLKMGAEWINIKVIKDLSHLTDEAFWLEAEKQNWANPYTVYGIRTIPPQRFEDMQDDAYRWLPFLLKGTVPDNGDMSKYKGPEYPVWIKVGDGIPFIEFKIARALLQNGIVYTHEMGDDLSVEFVEQCRAALVKAQIKGLLVVPTRKPFTQIVL